YSTTGSFGRKKNGERRNDKRNRQLSTEAEFWKHMALMKVGSTINIPRRRFLGYSPEVEQSVREIIEENLTEYFNHDFKV
ncbi:MAG: phage morphogenesis protein, partial [Bacteroidaceae bacterium]|nr:phage morphogenesis protein [Bacteroidaceae bacterium]